MAQLYGQRPPFPDLVADRYSPDRAERHRYQQAVKAMRQWVAMNYSRGVPLEQILSQVHDPGTREYDQAYRNWSQNRNTAGEPGNPQMAHAQAILQRFRRSIMQGSYTPWRLENGEEIYFNDPGNNPAAREWFNGWGDRISGPPDGGPEIDYSAIPPGMKIAQYLSERDKYGRAELEAKPITDQPITAPPPNAAPPVKLPPPSAPWGTSNLYGGPKPAAPLTSPTKVSAAPQRFAPASTPIEPGGINPRPTKPFFGLRKRPWTF